MANAVFRLLHVVFKSLPHCYAKVAHQEGFFLADGSTPIQVVASLCWFRLLREQVRGILSKYPQLAHSTGAVECRSYFEEQLKYVSCPRRSSWQIGNLQSENVISAMLNICPRNECKSPHIFSRSCLFVGLVNFYVRDLVSPQVQLFDVSPNLGMPHYYLLDPVVQILMGKLSEWESHILLLGSSVDKSIPISEEPSRQSSKISSRFIYNEWLRVIEQKYLAYKQAAGQGSAASQDEVVQGARINQAHIFTYVQLAILLRSYLWKRFKVLEGPNSHLTALYCLCLAKSEFHSSFVNTVTDVIKQVCQQNSDLAIDKVPALSKEELDLWGGLSTQIESEMQELQLPGYLVAGKNLSSVQILEEVLQSLVVSR